jgi:hypothetical protein
MSGLEVIGVIASIAQIANLGIKLSVKLCTFYRRVKDANQSIQSLSSEVSLTCTILQELGAALCRDEQAKVCSEKAFKTTQEVLGECIIVFNRIDEATEEENTRAGKGRFQLRAQKFTIAFMSSDIDLLRSNLERLKSTMLLMLNVIMYAGSFAGTTYLDFEVATAD